jgi:hypothetical protein
MDSENTMTDFMEGQIFTAEGFPEAFSYDYENEIKTSKPAYIVYLGPDKNMSFYLRFLAVLKNGDVIVISENKSELNSYIDKGLIKKSENINPLLQEIKNYLPERQEKEKNNVQIVGSEVNLPPGIKNKLLSFLGRYTENENQFPNDYKNEYNNDNQKAGRHYKIKKRLQLKSRRSRRSRKSRRSRRSRKSRRSRRSRKSRKSRK